jgi:hypothetical protein
MCALRDQRKSSKSEQPSVIIVEVLGFCGGDGSEDSQRRQQEERRTRSDRKQDYDPNSAFRLIGNGDLNPEQQRNLTEGERKTFNRQVERERGALIHVRSVQVVLSASGSIAIAAGRSRGAGS